VKDPLRPLSPEERTVLEQIARSRSDPAEHVIRPTLLLAVASGMSHSAAARSVRRRSNDAVTHLVSRFNREGLAALAPRSSGGGEPIYGTPDRESDGTATWSLSTLQRALRRAPDGLPRVSTHTIWTVLQEAGYRFGRDRTCCHTGVVLRKRKSGVVEVIDPDAAPKKS
jgi:transposase